MGDQPFGLPRFAQVIAPENRQRLRFERDLQLIIGDNHPVVAERLRPEVLLERGHHGVLFRRHPLRLRPQVLTTGQRQRNPGGSTGPGSNGTPTVLTHPHGRQVRGYRVAGLSGPLRALSLRVHRHQVAVGDRGVVGVPGHAPGRWPSGSGGHCTATTWAPRPAARQPERRPRVPPTRSHPTHRKPETGRPLTSTRSTVNPARSRDSAEQLSSTRVSNTACARSVFGRMS